jgi:hypothetical protein
VNSITNREPVSVSSYHFEVEPETRRARVVVEYTYPDQLIYGGEDPLRGPQPSFAQVPGLTYDPTAHAVVFQADDRRAICAQVTERRGRFGGERRKVTSPGECTVTAARMVHTVDTGWNRIRLRALDTYLEIR